MYIAGPYSQISFFKVILVVFFVVVVDSGGCENSLEIFSNVTEARQLS